ncbi:hypothetical protein K6Y31_13505 [Motilimonas cestriensis]|uniref:DUF1579 domain-containing protein n=1 Tax=Motilimonas cestriensis TaxID=2742685 RepID=A0ABS8WC38_9GAMM|nr:hypothetical protein [Motilimonas cestriensis]MCE2595823.1 hypothetical protein [Motilimonas cestriensis]
MELTSLVGSWVLIGSVAINSEVAFIGEDTDPNGVGNWLNGRAGELVGQIKTVNGLTLTIADNGAFTEVKTGKLSITWYDQEGVLESEVEPFNGTLVLKGEGAFLVAEAIPNWAQPTANDYGVALRYDDGDTIIAEWLECIDNRLVRTVNVVTDELYLDRIVMVYQKS